jgi:ribonuclease P protein component
VRVRSRRQYQRIAQQSKRYVGYWVIIESRLNKTSSTKLGITASRHYGIAVQRNRFKRIVRESFRLCRTKLQPGFDINIKPRHAAHQAKLIDIQTELLNFLGIKEALHQPAVCTSN